MIGYLTGKAIGADLVVVGGVGYVVATPQGLQVGTEVELWVHTVVRETEISLYGFSSAAERELFGCITKVTGVGPKMALGLLSLGAAAVVAAVRDQDAMALAKAPGVGIKRAQSLLTALAVPAELAEQFGGGQLDEFADLTDALVGLGHDRDRARKALEDVRSAGGPDDPSRMLRAAIGRLAA